MKKEFIESICAINGEIQLLEYHQNRVNKTFQNFFSSQAFQIQEFLKPLKIPKKGKIKIRIAYNENINKIDFEAYQLKKHAQFKLIEIEDFDYSFKYKDRKFFKGFKNFQPIFYKNKFITDCSYANLIFKKNNTWFTPKTYLLNGVKRQYLLNTHKIEIKEISIHNIFEFEAFGLINAMLDIGENVYPISLLESKLS